MSETYVKSYDVGNIQLDAPYAHFIHYLPLLSFGDIVHTVGLSLVYHSRLTGNPFNIAPGFKLNVQKRLIISNNVPTGIEEGGGRLISLNNFSPNYMLDDESQRVLRTVTENGVVYYELENPDYSSEKYNSLGQIISMTDKYGEAYLLFNYTSGKLTSVAFRPSIYNGAKVINLSYANDKLDYVEYISGNSAFRTNFSYNNGLVVKHYSGVDYHIENAEDYIAYSTDKDSAYSDSYSQKLTCSKSTDSISVEKRTGTKLVDTTTYQFYELNESERFKILEITDKHGIKTRIQYEGNIPKYSYEYTGEISPHYTKCYSGTVSIYKENEVIGTQTYDSGIKMTNTAGTNNWTANVNLSQATEDCYFILSGWILTNHLPQCELTISDNFGNQVQSTITDLGYNAFRYFTAKFDFSAPQSITVSSSLGTDNMLTRDFRISVNRGDSITNLSTNHFTQIEEVLIPEQVATGGFKEFPLAITELFYNGDNQILKRITYNDILRYKINQRLGTHPNEIYYDGCRGIIANAGEFRIKYRASPDSEDTIIKIDDLAIGKIFYKNGNKHIHKTDFSDDLGYPNLTTRKYTNGQYYEQIFYDDKLNEIIVLENDYSAISITTNEKGLTTTKKL